MGTTEVGRTGARFGSVGAKRSAAGKRDEGEPEQTEDRSGPTGARFGPYSQRRRRRDEPDDFFEMPAEVVPVTVERPPRDERLPLESNVLIRPYARTGGRTKPAQDLALESLISTNPGAAGSGRYPSWEHRLIADLCLRPRSVAEVAAMLSIPLGVARILLVDMAAAGTVVVHGGSGHRPPDLVLMGRVLAGLRRL
ncbi:MAG TPA: DUF742 domain-containing protein [Actinophytocola sp.]|uniref:DUF742 domain-containing protein n=1 Tax=Actinophytocola sp. TaxID=1872138 RepID=UPI002DDD40A0|nr:DUF742 domain-containing protein [Actinophytocola sp.]HEV2781385.1 DUF742 domain-containing protein [Actinophytocola sp.]